MQQTDACCHQHRHVCSLAQEYLLGDEIGEGAHARVIAAKHLETGEMRALKICPKGTAVGEDCNEPTILSFLDHENLVRAYEVLETDTEVVIVFELMHTDLYYTLYRKRRFGEEALRDACAEVGKALFYLHSNDIIHRDIKLENILVGKDGSYKLGDFGYSKLVSGANKPMGTSFYQAPEVLKAQMENEMLGDEESKAADMFSFGVLLFYLACGRPPYVGRSFPPAERRKLYTTMSTHCVEPTDSRFPSAISSDARSLISLLLSASPSSRPTAAEVLQHPWLSQEMHISKLVDSRGEAMVATSSLVYCPA